ncbi:MAG: hypothetical protein LUB60_03345 [Clostridiales bacterium]|nr:hypothetical protein [Clostridiales bacterium]
MKKKYLAVIMGIAVGASLLAGCGTGTSTSTNTESSAEEEAATEKVYGEITALGENSFTLDSGIGDAIEVTVTDDTEITTQVATGGMGNMEGGGDMEMPSDGETGDGEGGGMEGGGDEAAPEMPSDSGEGADGEATETSGGSAPEMPSDDMGDMGDMSDMGGGTTAMEFSDLAIGDVVMVTYDEDGNAASILVLYSETSAETSAAGSGSSASASGVTYTAVNEYSTDATVSGETITSTGTDENAALITSGANVTITDSTVTRDSSDSAGGDNSSFYGVEAAILTTEGTTYISDTTIETDAAGGAGVFAYGDGVVYVSDSTITTQQDTSGGIHAAGGGTLYAWDLTVETNGESAAAIRSDRGGGTMVVDGGSYTSNGVGSPAVYCTADIAINDAELTATASEAVCIEGLNSLRLFDCDLTGNMADDSQNDCTWNVILYQSMSGDSEVGNSVFEMVGGTLTAENGGMFYTTNTESTFILSGVDITYADENDFFLQCTGNSNERGWGSTGSNGADCSFTAIEQEMEGDIIWDSISRLDFYMTDGSTLTGAVVNDETWAGSGGDGYCNLYIDADSTWIVTGDSVLTALQNEGTIVDASGNTVTIQGSDGTVYVQGSSEYTITVDSYETTADLSGASAVTSWSDYEAEKPDEL